MTPDALRAIDPDDPIPPLRDLLDLTDHEATLAALGVLDAKLAVVIADQERLIRLLERVAGVVDVRLVTP